MQDGITENVWGVSALPIVHIEPSTPLSTDAQNSCLWIARRNSSDDIAKAHFWAIVFCFSFLRSKYIVAVLPICAEPSVRNSYGCAYRSRIMTKDPVLRAIEGGRKSLLPLLVGQLLCDLMSVWTDIKFLYHQQPIAALHFPQIALDLAAALITQCWRNELFCLPTITMSGILFQPFRAIVFLKNE